MQQALQYEAAGAGHIDCLDVYTTDGRLTVHDLVVLEGRQAVLPRLRGDGAGARRDARPPSEVGATLGLLAGGIDAATMRQSERACRNRR
jgi:osmoprotectant transport system permease protein